MSLAFLTALLQRFISLLRCPKQKSALLPPGATGDPQPVAKKGTRWASPPLGFTESFEPCTQDRCCIALNVYLEQGLITCGPQNAELLAAQLWLLQGCRGVCMLPPWYCLPENWGKEP